MGYRQLVRSLRTNAMSRLKIMQPPVELNALAQLLREEGISSHVCTPGTPELPYTKSALWRISCRVDLDTHFEVSIVGENVLIRRCQLYDTRSNRDGEPSPIGYQGVCGDYTSTMSAAKIIFIPLADPESIKQVAKAIRTWTR